MAAPRGKRPSQLALFIWHMVVWPVALVVTVVFGPTVAWRQALALAWLALWLAALVRAVRRERRSIVARFSGLAVVAGALFLSSVHKFPIGPVTYQSLDAMAQPADYGETTFEDLCRRIGDDHGLWVSAGEFRSRRARFRIERPMTHRQLLEKLARELDVDVYVGGHCGTCGAIMAIYAEKKRQDVGRVVSWRDQP